MLKPLSNVDDVKQILGHAFVPKNLLHPILVEDGALEVAVEVLAPATRVEVDPLLHLTVVNQLDAGKRLGLDVDGIVGELVGARLEMIPAQQIDPRHLLLVRVHLRGRHAVGLQHESVLRTGRRGAVPVLTKDLRLRRTHLMLGIFHPVEELAAGESQAGAGAEHVSGCPCEPSCSSR